MTATISEVLSIAFPVLPLLNPGSAQQSNPCATYSCPKDPCTQMVYTLGYEVPTITVLGQLQTLLPKHPNTGPTPYTLKSSSHTLNPKILTPRTLKSYPKSTTVKLQTQALNHKSQPKAPPQSPIKLSPSTRPRRKPYRNLKPRTLKP